ncbi:MAG: hypothetical protein U1E26_03605 [Coriobacteriia bacterium]|nr:hypothetical protein [Coriobacteriia bacterium]
MGSTEFAYIVYAIAQAVVAVWAFVLWRKDRTVGALALLLPIAAVWYDNLIIALGGFIGPGPMLQALTFPRFAGHALLTPLWIVAAVSFAVRAGAFAKRARTVVIGSYVLYGAMVAVGLLNEVVFFKGELVTEGDAVYYTNVGRLFTPPPPSLTMLVVVLICGALVLWHTRWPWMLLGALPVPLSQFLRSDSSAFLLVNSGEVIMSVSLVATLAFLQRRKV